MGKLTKLKCASMGSNNTDSTLIRLKQTPIGRERDRERRGEKRRERE